MAAAQKKNNQKSTKSKSSGKRSSAPKKTNTAAKTKNSGRRSAPPKKRPIRREVGGAVFLLLALFAGVGYFDTEAIFIAFFAQQLRGLFGYGFYVLPPAFLLTGLILLFHRGRPVRLRTACMLASPVLIGGILQILLCRQPLVADIATLKILWETGAAMESGGLICGALGFGCQKLFGEFASITIFVALTLLCLLTALKVDPTELYRRAKSRRVEYDRQDYEYEEYEPEQGPISSGIVVKETPRRGKRMIDIPLDNEPESVLAVREENAARAREARENPQSFFNEVSNKEKPHEAIMRMLGWGGGGKRVEGRQKPAPVREMPAPAAEAVPPAAEQPARQEAPAASRMEAVEKPQPVPVQPSEQPLSPQEPHGQYDPAPVRESAATAAAAAAMTERTMGAAAAPRRQEETVQEPPQTPSVHPHPVQDAPEPEYQEPTPAVIGGGTQVRHTETAQAQAAHRESGRTETAAAAADFQPPTKKQTEAEIAAATAEVAAAVAQNAPVEKVYEYPPLELLNGEHSGDAALAEAEQRSNLERLCDTLRSFGIRASSGDVVRGPSVTQYEFHLEQGVKLSKVTSLSDDLALSLGVSNIRIAPIPEKNSVIGIEVPNKHSSMVLIRDVLEGSTFRNHKSRVAFSVGRDIAGHDIVGNISKLPHVLIAGTTGSGKSVCINSLIVSLLYKATPDEVRFIMVDPKMVELNPYNGIPHLLIPVVTDPKKAAGALQWAVFEMMKRYKAFSEHNVKDLSSFNKLAKTDPELQKLPTVVVVIDELADLMMVAAKEVEESICRVAQMGRAAGVHLVIATQRPSADIITGIMKANIPSRIAFAVASSMESRIILDMPGAEKLVGKGDMLYSPVSSGKPHRVQGCMITEEEIDRVVEFVKNQNGEAQYSEEVSKKIEETLTDSKGDSRSAAAEAVQDETDPLFDDGVEVLLETGQASVSMLQRRLKLGYSRAARMIDQMEERGIVGPFEGSKPRQLLVSRASWDAYKNGGIPVGEDEDEEPEEELQEEPREIDIEIPDLPEAEVEEAAPWDEEAPGEPQKLS